MITVQFAGLVLCVITVSVTARIGNLLDKYIVACEAGICGIGNFISQDNL